MPASQHSLKSILEAMLLVGDRPIGLKKFTQLLPEYDRGAIITTLKILQREYNDEKRGFELKEVAGGFRLQTRKDLRSWLLRLKRSSPARLSRAALETLAVVAYRQPATRADIETIRGVDASGTLNFLLNRKIIRIVGRKALPGRPLLYGTTRQFLEIFELKDLSDLPSLAEMAELERQTNGVPQIPLFR
ncbi:MAG: SMC-Scp complex subunit ScpB [Dissulfuribacterales bacterium]